MSEVAPSLVIVIPTYCESANVETLLNRIQTALAPSGTHYEVLFVDDDSPDGTADEVMRCIAHGQPAKLIVRKNTRGLATAVIAGFDAACDSRYLACMDGDLSHPAEALPGMLQVLESQPDLEMVIGSRYVAEGRTETGWGWWNAVNSRVATLLARPLTPIRDPMSGYFVMRRRVYERASGLEPVGYKILLELLVKTGCARVQEWPIEFRKRVHGRSKLGLAERFRYLRHLGRLYVYRYGNWARYVQFGIVGLAGFCIDLTAFGLMLEAGVAVGVARALAIWLALSSNFILNRRFTFGDARVRPVSAQYLEYLSCCLLGNALSWGVSVGLIIYQGTHPLLAAVIGILLGSVSNFLLVRHTAFRV